MSNTESLDTSKISSKREKKVKVDLNNSKEVLKANKLVKKIEKEMKKTNFPVLHATQIDGESLDVLVINTDLGFMNVINPQVVGLSSKVNFKLNNVSFKPYKSIQIQGYTFKGENGKNTEELTFIRFKLNEKNLAFLTQFSLLEMN